MKSLTARQHSMPIHCWSTRHAISGAMPRDIVMQPGQLQREEERDTEKEKEGEIERGGEEMRGKDRKVER